MKLKDSELKSILAEVETEIASLLKTESDTLKKAKGPDGDDDAPAPGEASAPAEGSAPEASASASPAPEASAPAASASPEASASAPPAPEASASPAPGAAPEASAAPGADPAADQVADPAALQAEYLKLDPESLKAHYMACKAALFQLMGAAAGAGPEASASPAAGAPAPAAPEASSTEMTPPPALKAEVPASIKNVPATADLADAGKGGGKGGLQDVKKSEDADKIADLERQIELLAKAVEVAVGTPIRKAITSVAHISRTEEAPVGKDLSKSEIKDKIKKALVAGKLSKSQKEMLFSYSLGNTEFDSIKDFI